jgi:hypothetical protein
MDDLVLSILKALLVAKHTAKPSTYVYTLSAVNRGHSQPDGSYSQGYIYETTWRVTRTETRWNVVLHMTPHMVGKQLCFHLLYSQDIYGSNLRDSLEVAANKILKDRVLEAITGDFK